MIQEPIIDHKDLDIKIVNVVASVTLNQKFNLLDIVKTFRNVEYNPKRFPGLVFRLKNQKPELFKITEQEQINQITAQLASSFLRWLIE